MYFLLNFLIITLFLGLASSTSDSLAWHFNEETYSKRIKRASEPEKNLIDEVPCSQLLQLCNELSRGTEDLFVLECIQTLKPNQLEKIDEQCQHLIWKHTWDLIDDRNVHEIAQKACSSELDKIDCHVSNEPGQLLACILDHREEIGNNVCIGWIQRLEWVAFSDFRLITSFVKDCQESVDDFNCGRLNANKETLSQGETIACLQNHIDKLPDKCKKEILHLSELQADNIRLDRQLYLACATDHLRFCPDLRPGSGLVFKCLMIHKVDPSMTKHCQDQLVRREKLITQDYKVSRGLARACKDDIKAFHCRRGISENKEIRLAQILLCLEGAVRNNSDIDKGCRAEMNDHRKLLMQDYRLSPEIIDGCSEDIKKFCNNLDIGGRTIHCLMEHARPKKNNNRRISATCQRALEVLIKNTDAGEDWRVDPVLREACKPVVDVACKEVKGGEARVLSCLMEKLGTDHMTEDCETALVQIQYFVARDFKLDPQLYKACKDDAMLKCHAKKGWIDDVSTEMDPERGPLILPCLYRYAYHSETSMQLRPKCVQEIRRVMRQRAVSVDLLPEVEEVCLDDLAMFCFEKTGKGEEMQCLQSNLEHLEDKCHAAVSNFTEVEAENIELNPVIMSVCKGTMEKYCGSILKKGKDDGSLIECLIAHKNEPDVRQEMKCRAAIEHFQLISLKDFHFTFKFKEACKPHVSRHCPRANTKYEIVACLSEVVRDETIKGVRHTIPKECRQQIRAQLYQQRENVDFDLAIKKGCSDDIKKYCGNIEHGAAQVLECLMQQTGLSKPCRHIMFNIKKQDLTDNSVDYALINSCRDMITQYCHNTDHSSVLTCLRTHLSDPQFESKCKVIVIHRMIEQNTDYRFNPALQAACSMDITKFCNDIILKEVNNEELNGKVVECLKGKFRLAKLSRKCEGQMTIILKEQALNYMLNPLLATMCKPEIDTICKPNDALDQEGAGEVEECLKAAFLQHKIVSKGCKFEVATLIEEAQADIHVDPLLQQSCAVDLLKYCNDVPTGGGRLIKCLQVILADEKKPLEKECRSKLTGRMEMFKNAAIVAPEGVQDLYYQVVASPAKTYFMFVTLSAIFMIFVFGLVCGRATRRALVLKNK